MPFVPEIPVHRPGEAFRLGGDAMLGPFELFKWPQVFDECQVHAMAAPGNPDLIANLRYVTFPMVDDQQVLPVFADPSITWWHFTSDEWTVCTDIPAAQIGVFHESVVQRFRDAVQEVAMHVKMTADRELMPAPGDSAAQRRRLDDRSRYILHLILRLQTTVTRLKEMPMTSFDAAQWFREAQRLLLEVRAWIIYVDIVTPVLKAPTSATKHMCFRVVGAPVVHLNYHHHHHASAHGGRVVGSFQYENPLRHGKNNSPAPEWLKSSTFDDLSESMMDQLRKFSLSSQPTLRRVHPVWEDQSELESQAAEVHPVEIQEPDFFGDSAPAPDCPKGRDDDRGGRPHGFITEVWPALKDRPNVSPTVCPAEPHINIRPQRGRRKRRKKNQRPPDAGSRHRQLASAPTSAPAASDACSPPWASLPCSGWSAAVATLTLILQAHPPPPQLYSLLPPHLFYAQGELIGRRFHNWLRIRMYCVTQAINPPANGKVLMTTGQWRIALEGRYHAIPYSALAVRPMSSPDDIAQLPVGPAVDAVRGKRTRDLVDGEAPDQLLDIDRELVPHLYSDDGTTGQSATRERKLKSIWSEDAYIRPMLDDEGMVDILAAPHWEMRRVGYVRWAGVMQQWPDWQLEWDEEDLTDEHAYSAFEIRVVAAYCRTFFGVRGRTPTFPLVPPGSLSRHVQHAWGKDMAA
ncbi:hypothetical protein A0H81_01599 [Grifola frondosa]|uniref:Uncharacterized protein n=1 Tax=Grifola frondosa TaxID=5627 RepID=A0A1C7MPV8_GRIFR|nr:hypothetical protein A0H81_01599 [Grifola frondosa]